MPYQVFVDDNYHFTDTDERRGPIEFATADLALAYCRSNVDDFLLHGYKPGMTAADLFAGYKQYGEDPFIVANGMPPVEFSAWTYAEQRCGEIAAGKP